MKTSFKLLYGLLDKIGFFINSYFDLKISDNKVSFDIVWNKKDQNNCKILNPKKNFALASLYWIHKDFFKENNNNCPNPHFSRLREVRNALEHRYVKIVDARFSDDYIDGKFDDIVFYVTEDELYDLTLKLLKILREAIICLSLCVNIEETYKKDKLPDDTIIVPFYFSNYDDEWKI